jgi:hypothetical protein
MSNIIVQQENIQVCNVVIHNNIQTITSITNLKNVDIELLEDKVDTVQANIDAVSLSINAIENDINDTNDIIFKNVSLDSAEDLFNNL